jgi:hypothetical protein
MTINDRYQKHGVSYGAKPNVPQKGRRFPQRKADAPSANSAYPGVSTYSADPSPAVIFWTFSISACRPDHPRIWPCLHWISPDGISMRPQPGRETAGP